MLMNLGWSNSQPQIKKQMAREVKKGYQNPMMYRLNQFVDFHNAEVSKAINPKKGDKIRCGKYTNATAIILAYWNANKEEIAKLEGKSHEFLPSLFTNNVELRERTLLDANSSSWRSVSWLCDLSIGDNMGVFMTKTFHGRKSDYQIRINPFFITGEVVYNWGKACEKLTEADTEAKKLEALQTPLNLSIISKCSPPTLSKTYINVNNTTTSLCGKVEKVSNTQKQQQTHDPKTKGESFMVLKGNDASLSSTAKTKSGGAGGAIFSNPSVTAGNSDLNGKGHNRTSIQDHNKPKSTQSTRLEQVEAYATQLIEQFFMYSTGLLYPNYRFSKNEAQKIKEIIRNSWYAKGIHAMTMRDDLNKQQESMFELVTIALQEVQNNPQFSYIHPDAKVFFNHNFKHGLVRAYGRMKQRRIAKDLNMVLSAQKSVKNFKIPRGVKTVNTLPQLIQYWQHRLDTQSFNKQSTLHSFNVFLSNPKNLYVN